MINLCGDKTLFLKQCAKTFESSELQEILTYKSTFILEEVQVN